MKGKIYNWLMKNKAKDGGIEAHLLALIISSKAESAYWTLNDMLGLSNAEFKALMAKYFPTALTTYKGNSCFKIYFYQQIEESFVCHCCGKAVTTTIEIRKTAVPIIKGYQTAENRKTEVDDLVNLFLANRSLNTEEEVWFAKIIATSALGENHLWQDLGLTGREDVSCLLKLFFTKLYAKNTGMKWKKFFYKQLCDMEEIKVCKAPSCSVCDHYSNCFGPEDIGSWACLLYTSPSPRD